MQTGARLLRQLRERTDIKPVVDDRGFMKLPPNRRAKDLQKDDWVVYSSWASSYPCMSAG